MATLVQLATSVYIGLRVQLIDWLVQFYKYQRISLSRHYYVHLIFSDIICAALYHRLCEQLIEY